MIHRALARLLTAPDSPTADLYFMNACGDLLCPALRRLGPTVFVSGHTCLVMRHDLRAAGLAEVLPGRRLIYLIDDAVEEGPGDASLAFLYRQKLRLVDRDASRRIVPRAAAVVVSSPALVKHYAGEVETHLIHPYWSDPFAGDSHFDTALRGEGWIDIAYLGSAVHRADLAFLWPVIGGVLAAYPRARFHLSDRHRVPAGMAGHPRILAIPARGWTIYRAALRGRRFHLALYPLMDTPYNRARSINKLIEHGMVGAAPLYSGTWPEAWRAGAAGAGLLLDNRAEEWRAAIEALIASPGAMCGLAARATALAHTLNQAGPQRRLWSRLLEGEFNAVA